MKMFSKQKEINDPLHQTEQALRASENYIVLTPAVRVYLETRQKFTAICHLPEHEALENAIKRHPDVQLYIALKNAQNRLNL